MRTRSVPSGRRTIRAIAPSTPTEYSSSGPGVSTSGSRPATSTIDRSPRRTSLTSSRLRGWPMLSGMTSSGKVTESRSGSTPSCAGRRRNPFSCSWSASPRRGADVERRSLRRRRSGSEPRGGRPCAADQRQLDAQHPVLVAGADAVGVDVGAELDEAAEGSALDLDLLVAVGGGLGRAAAAGQEQLAALDLQRDVRGVHAGQLRRHDRPGRIGARRRRRPPATGRCAGASSPERSNTSPNSSSISASHPFEVGKQITLRTWPKRTARAHDACRRRPRRPAPPVRRSRRRPRRASARGRARRSSG